MKDSTGRALIEGLVDRVKMLEYDLNESVAAHSKLRQELVRVKILPTSDKFCLSAAPRSIKLEDLEESINDILEYLKVSYFTHASRGKLVKNDE